MKPPVEHIRVSARGKEILSKIKRNTGLEHWNEICRIAFCASLANPTAPPRYQKQDDSNIDIEWKTFAGSLQAEFAALTLLRAKRDDIDLSKRDALAEYFRNHLERGIQSIQNIKGMAALSKLCQEPERRPHP